MTPDSSSKSPLPAAAVLATLLGVSLAAIGAAAALHRQWPQPVRDWVIGQLQGAATADAPAAAHDSSHDHDHAADASHADHTEENSLTLSDQARRTIGLTEGDVTLRTFERTIGVPGMVVERKGRSRFTIIAPLTGFITKIEITEGAAVSPGQPLFELRLTHEELVQLQADLLKTTAEVDVVRREIARLQGIGPEGLIPTKMILERQYEVEKLEAVLESQRQALLLHGLSNEQVEGILTTRTLLHTIAVRAPSRDAPPAADTAGATLLVQELLVEQGQHVNAGDTLAILVDHETLLIEGEAFEQDLPQILEAAKEKRPVTAVLETKVGPATRLDGLAIASVASRVDYESRALHFYVSLPNEQIATGSGDGRFVTWRFKPGQRMQLLVPVETWRDRIVLPPEAVAQDGLEHYVFMTHGDHVHRQPVHVEYRDPTAVVIANDGALSPGDQIAMTAAQQLQLALKNASGGAIDPHAGHSH
ncbi:biotin/lipoyl-binding protein [bacterium]|nr:biotin/lipoyl-binding protein [bacterium]